MTRKNIITIVYDGKCTFCANYCKLVRIKAAAGSIRLIDARCSSAIMDEITALGLDIDQGMVVKLNEHIYFGAKAINILALLSSRSNFFNRLTFLLFRSKATALMLYPILKTCRNFILWLLNIPKINNLKRMETPRKLYE